jgi:hypothetical protein
VTGEKRWRGWLTSLARCMLVSLSWVRTQRRWNVNPLRQSIDMSDMIPPAYAVADPDRDDGAVVQDTPPSYELLSPLATIDRSSSTTSRMQVLSGEADVGRPIPDTLLRFEVPLDDQPPQFEAMPATQDPVPPVVISAAIVGHEDAPPTRPGKACSEV